MNISNISQKRKTKISFEIFPPADTLPLNSIYEKVDEFKKLNPDFISVTYGAGGSKKGKTIEIASKIKNFYNVECMAHFTCIGHSIAEIDQMLVELKENNIDNVLALRGDIPLSIPDFDMSKNVFKHASELIKHIKKDNDFFVAAAAYIEGHPNSNSIKNDLCFLKQKVDCGVDLLITQLFFDNRVFFDYVDRARDLGINCPISAGIMPLFKYDQIKTMAAKSLCSFPAKLITAMDKYQNNPDDIRKAGLEYTINQIQNLIDNGVDGIHIYTMNRPKSTKEILSSINL